MERCFEFHQGSYKSIDIYYDLHKTKQKINFNLSIFSQTSKPKHVNGNHQVERLSNARYSTSSRPTPSVKTIYKIESNRHLMLDENVKMAHNNY